MDSDIGLNGSGARCIRYAPWAVLLVESRKKHQNLISLDQTLGIVRAPITTTLMQVASRLLLVWGIVDQFPHLAQSPVYSSMVIAWSVTEVIRYSYFVLNLNGYSLAISTWLRYNTFFVLYPMGISSECWMVYLAINPASKLRQEYAWILYAILAIYIPGMYFREYGCRPMLISR